MAGHKDHAPFLAQPSGIATLDVGGSVPSSQLGNVPASLPPSGTAGGSLSGTYPNPAVASAAITLAMLAALTSTAYNGVSPATPIALSSSPAVQISTNGTAGIDLELDLPVPSAGLIQVFAVKVAHFLKVKASTGVTIYFGTYGAGATAGFFRSNVPGSGVILVGIDSTTWFAFSISGTWTVDI